MVGSMEEPEIMLRALYRSMSYFDSDCMTQKYNIFNKIGIGKGHGKCGMIKDF